jgi:collagenase-like PrtC family protease
MKFSVGYQPSQPGEESFVDIVGEFREHVAEVYFPWVGEPSGRSPIGLRGGRPDQVAQRRLEEDLLALRGLGLRLNLLLNANCYGARAASRQLEGRVVAVLEHLSRLVGGVEAATTASPAVAHVVKTHFPQVETRASVNMRIGTIAGMQYVADLFDGYHVQRDHNRDLPHLRRLKRWADANGKRLYLLANSGCLRFCPGQTFHDNLVAHEIETPEADGIAGFTPFVCWRLLRDRSNWPAVLQATWIRPEDLHHYEGLFDVVKLATRTHDRPWVVLRAYAERRWRGNLLDLFEPGFSPAFAPCVLDNERFPPDWFERTSTCGHRCERCTYCVDVLREALVSVEQYAAPPA